MAGLFPHGTTFTFGGIHVGGLQDVDLPERTRAEVEVTDHDSNFDREFVPGLRDSGTVTIPLRMIPGDPGQEALITAMGNEDDVRQCVIFLPPHASPRLSWTFDAWVQTMGGTLPWENTAASRSVVLRVTGAVQEGTIEGATMLAFTTQPSTVAADTPIDPPVVVEVQDGAGNLVDDFTGQVVLTIGNNPSGGSLVGNVENAESGVATFDALEVDEAGEGYTLIAHASGMPSVQSTAFDVTPS